MRQRELSTDQKDKYSRKNLTDDTVWICSPDAYNDPFDSLFTVAEQDVLIAAKRSMVDSFVKTYSLEAVIPAEVIQKVKLSDEPLQELIKQIPPGHPFVKGSNPQQAADFAGMQLSKFIEQSMAFVSQIRNATKICSFSQRSDSILMWGHYADGHKGFCIEYNLETLPANCTFRRNLYPVNYSLALFDLTKWASQLVSTARDKFNQAEILLVMLSKYSDWSYEQEWRWVRTEPRLADNGPLPVPKPTRVFLGAKIEEPSQTELTDICKAKGIEVWKMAKAKDSFKLDSERIA